MLGVCCPTQDCLYRCKVAGSVCIVFCGWTAAMSLLMTRLSGLTRSCGAQEATQDHTQSQHADCFTKNAICFVFNWKTINVCYYSRSPHCVAMLAGSAGSFFRKIFSINLGPQTLHHNQESFRIHPFSVVQFPPARLPPEILNRVSNLQKNRLIF